MAALTDSSTPVRRNFCDQAGAAISRLWIGDLLTGKRARLWSNPRAAGLFSGFNPRCHFPDMTVL